jgi:hypothetical protein
MITRALDGRDQGPGKPTAGGGAGHRRARCCDGTRDYPVGAVEVIPGEGFPAYLKGTDPRAVESGRYRVSRGSAASPSMGKATRKREGVERA